MSILSRNYTPRQLNELVALSHSIAIAFLESKTASGSLNKEFLHLTIEDAAYDCIAELFRRDDKDRFFALKGYFSAFNLHSLSETEVLSHLRRLVFTKVNDGIARLYHQSDPALSKIIRNIRLAVHALGNLVEVERFGEIYLAPSACETLEHLPKLDEQELEKLLMPKVRGDENVLEITGKLALALREQSSSARLINILHAALAIRSIYSRKALPFAGESSPDDDEEKNEFLVLLQRAVNRTKQRLHEKYVLKKKINATTYSQYFTVIQSRLECMLTTDSNDGESLYSSLKTFLPKLTERQYRSGHKATLEYLLKLTRDEAAQEIRKKIIRRKNPADESTL